MATHLLKLPLLLKISPTRLTIRSSSPPTPPSSREEAISQAKLSLSSSLMKPLNNPIPLSARKLKKPTQPRYRVEIPLADDSPDSLEQLVREVFSNLPITKKGSKPKILILWPNSDLDSVPDDEMKSADVAVLVAPESTQLEKIKTITNSLYPKPVILFNPKWAYEDEKEFKNGLGSFAGSFDVVYSFMGLEVKGVISRRKGVVLKRVSNGVVSADGWVVMIEEDEELKVVSQIKRRPTIGEVESVLYNVMAANSPVTKSIKFLRDFASNVTRKKDKK